MRGKEFVGKVTVDQLQTVLGQLENPKSVRHGVFGGRSFQIEVEGKITKVSLNVLIQRAVDLKVKDNDLVTRFKKIDNASCTFNGPLTLLWWAVHALRSIIFGNNAAREALYKHLEDTAPKVLSTPSPQDDNKVSEPVGTSTPPQDPPVDTPPEGSVNSAGGTDDTQRINVPADGAPINEPKDGETPKEVLKEDAGKVDDAFGQPKPEDLTLSRLPTDFPPTQPGGTSAVLETTPPVTTEASASAPKKEVLTITWNNRTYSRLSQLTRASQEAGVPVCVVRQGDKIQLSYVNEKGEWVHLPIHQNDAETVEKGIKGLLGETPYRLVTEAELASYPEFPKEHGTLFGEYLHVLPDGTKSMDYLRTLSWEERKAPPYQYALVWSPADPARYMLYARTGDGKFSERRYLVIASEGIVAYQGRSDTSPNFQVKTYTSFSEYMTQMKLDGHLLSAASSRPIITSASVAKKAGSSSPWNPLKWFGRGEETPPT